MKAIRFDGKPISVPGIYRGIPIERYHSADICVGPSLSSSGMKALFLESPAHYWCESCYNPKRVEREETRSMVLGSAAHLLLLGEKDFKQRFAIRPDDTLLPRAGISQWTKRNAICKAWEEARAKEGLTVLLPAQAEAIKGISASLAEHPMTDPRGDVKLLNGYIEHSGIWIDKRTKTFLRIRPDAIPAESPNFVDLKIVANVSDDWIATSIFEFGWFMQAALVGEGYEALTGEKMETFSFVFAESKPPYCVSVRTLKDADLERGRRANRVAIDRFAACFKAKKWPGPGGEQRDAAFVEMPIWAQKRIDDQLALEGL